MISGARGSEVGVAEMASERNFGVRRQAVATKAGASFRTPQTETLPFWRLDSLPTLWDGFGRDDHMLFYVKKIWWLELAVTALLGSIGYWGIRRFSISIDWTANVRTLALGIGGFVGLSIWNLGVQTGYRIFKGKDYAEELTGSLAKEFARATPAQIVLGGLTAALGEEIFFRGFIQCAWGILAGTALFGLAHWGKKDIRVVSLWSFAQGFLLGLLFWGSGRLLVPMIAHGLFDISGFAYFRIFMARRERSA